MKKNLLYIMIVMFLPTILSATISADDIASVMQKKIDYTTNLLQKNDDNKKGVAKEIFAQFDPIFDFELMAKLSLGSKQLKKLTNKQKNIFFKKFEERLKSSYVDKLSLYTDEKVKVLKIEDTKNRKILKTELVSKDKKYQIDYKFYDAKQRGWLIYDVNILGVSIIQTYKNQFERVLDNDSFEKLLELLQRAKISTK